VTRVVVFAKSPVPGRVKTRLSPPYTRVDAARLAAAALQDTLAAALATRRSVVLALDGAPPKWVPAAVHVVPQVRGAFDVRLAAAVTAGRPGPVVVVGMDTPQLTPRLLGLAADAVDGATAAVFGPALDGGWWLLGLASPRPDLLLGVPASTPHTGTLQRRRLVDAGLSVTDLPELRDVDTADDVTAVARAAAGTRFARLVRRLDPLRGAPP
jgi:glycosyltransferase A (GT-A) superfamily protein (DUF2064 family)